MGKREPTLTQHACEDTAGRWQVLIDRNRCEGKEDCTRVCPEGVFEIRRLTDDEFAGVTGWFNRFRVRVHGRRQAFAVHQADCRYCRRCEAACPEQAISVLPGSS